ncbi:hypothetical protein K7X08_036048 [Anisodus acutangulus]|uniref:Uncharacterized protein n=1 Tax=Anisodus acutangulus TaxID=402998 RepID=A0A9Q1QWI0_9SOLA|nr:hypothetical protein K7X08_036048 [Anisodus acutangulus]
MTVAGSWKGEIKGKSGASFLNSATGFIKQQFSKSCEVLKTGYGPSITTSQVFKPAIRLVLYTFGRHGQGAL